MSTTLGATSSRQRRASAARKETGVSGFASTKPVA